MNRQMVLLIVASIMGFASISNAQSSYFSRYLEGERFGVPREYRTLLYIDAVQKELAIGPEQLEELEQVLENPPSIAKASDKRVAMQEFEASLEEVLDPDQWKRCVELRIQKAGSASLIREDIVAKLSLSEKQLADLRKLREQAISDAFSAGFRLGFRPGDPSPAELKKNAAERRARQERSLKKGLDMLTQAQRDRFDQLRGEPFAFPDSDE